MAGGIESLVGNPVAATAMDAARRVPEARAALGEFESYLVSQMLRNGVKPMAEEHLLDGGQAGRMYRELFFEEIGKIAARNGGLGLAGSLSEPMAREDGHE